VQPASLLTAQEDNMKKRIALIAALLAALGSLFGVSATGAQAATTYYYIVNFDGTGFCIQNTSHGKVMVTGSIGPPCATTFTFTNPVVDPTTKFTYYLIRINGGVDCLNYDPFTGWVYDDSCIPGDHNELWQHHNGALLMNYTSNSALAACNDTSNSALYASIFVPSRCSLSSGLREWATYPVPV
jgi:hypothetical protein